MFMQREPAPTPLEARARCGLCVVEAWEETYRARFRRRRRRKTGLAHTRKCFCRAPKGSGPLEDSMYRILLMPAMDRQAQERSISWRGGSSLQMHTQGTIPRRRSSAIRYRYGGRLVRIGDGPDRSLRMILAPADDPWQGLLTRERRLEIASLKQAGRTQGNGSTSGAVPFTQRKFHCKVSTANRLNQSCRWAKQINRLLWNIPSILSGLIYPAPNLRTPNSRCRSPCRYSVQ